MTQASPPRSRLGGGLPYALGCYLIWGLLPLYLHRVDAVPAVEFVAWRVVFTLPVCAVMIVAARRLGPLAQVLRNPRNLAVLTMSAALIGVNWLTYIIAVESHHLFAAAIGYYLNPLINVALGTLVLGESLRRAQWVATGFAASGVAVLAVAGLRNGEGATLWLSLILAGSFAFYGLIRKKLPVEPLVGLTMESLMLTPVALAYLWWQSAHGTMGFGHHPTVDMLIGISGLVTAVPLLLFAGAARRMDYSLLGFFQFLSPSIGVLLGLFVFHEVLTGAQMACFALIWSGIAVFCWDMARAARKG